MSTGRAVRQELIFSTYPKYSSRDIASFLISFSEYIIQKNKSLLRGDVIGPSQSIISNVNVTAVYAAMPVFFDDNFSTLQKTDPHTVIVWLIPLYREEAYYAKKHGWDSFEDISEKQQIDFWDLNRPSLDLKL